MDKETAQYCLIRALTFPLSLLPYSSLRWIGKGIGSVAFYFMRDYRKRAMSNLALAKDLNLGEKELVKIAKESFCNLAINCLEYPKFSREKNLSKVVTCDNPTKANSIYNQKKGLIFFCGHLSNWEVLFLDGTLRMKGIAIGKPIKNKKLYAWIVSIREKHGGNIISPQNAVREGFRALKKGSFLGIVGDQGMPDSGYSFPFLGRRAWTSTAPALLSYKTGCPIIHPSTHRTNKGYRIHYSDPIYPDLSKPLETEVPRLMDEALSLMQESIKKSPGEWLWQHNRWKQQSLKTLYKRFRKDSICIILPPDIHLVKQLLAPLETLKEIYATEFLSFIAPEAAKGLIDAEEIMYYRDIKDTLIRDYRFKLVFNFTNYRPVKKHYEKLSSFETIDLSTLKKLALPHLSFDSKDNLSEVFKTALCRPGSKWRLP